MTEHQARQQLRALRERRRWSWDRVAADLVMVLGRTSVTSKTLYRFDRGDFHPHRFTLEDISEYLKRSKDEAQAKGAA